jgi:hypothetical protein
MPLQKIVEQKGDRFIYPIIPKRVEQIEKIVGRRMATRGPGRSAKDMSKFLK